MLPLDQRMLFHAVVLGQLEHQQQEEAASPSPSSGAVGYESDSEFRVTAADMVSACAG